MPLFLIVTIFLMFGNPILNDSLDLETDTAGSDMTSDINSDYLAAAQGSEGSRIAGTAESNIFGSENLGQSGFISTSTDSSTSDIPSNANAPESPGIIQMNPDLEPNIFGSIADAESADASCSGDSSLDGTTTNVKKRQTLLSGILDWFFHDTPQNPPQNWCANPPIKPNPPPQPQPQPDTPAAPLAKPGNPQNPTEPAAETNMSPRIQGGSRYKGEVRSCGGGRAENYRDKTLICGGPPTDVEEAAVVEDCWRCTYISMLWIYELQIPLLIKLQFQSSLSKHRREDVGNAPIYQSVRFCNV